MKPVGAGDLRQTVRFERRGSGQNDGGFVEQDWAPLFSRPATLEPTKGGELIKAGRLQGQSGYDLWVRHDPQTVTLTTADQVVDLQDTSRIFDIRFGPEDMDGKRQWLLMQLQSASRE